MSKLRILDTRFTHFRNAFEGMYTVLSEPRHKSIAECERNFARIATLSSWCVVCLWLWISWVQ